MNYSKDQMKIYFLSFQYQLLMQLLGTSIEIPTIDGKKAKLKFQMVHKVENNLD